MDCKVKAKIVLSIETTLDSQEIPNDEIIKYCLEQDLLDAGYVVNSIEVTEAESEMGEL